MKDDGSCTLGGEQDTPAHVPQNQEANIGEGLCKPVLLHGALTLHPILDRSNA